MTSRVRTAVAAALVAAALGGVSSAATSGGGSSQLAARTMVIAELFTSEGCSSCPPADALLRQLLRTQPIEGVEIVGLGSHVDYWDNLGWRDPFSSPVFSQRQSSYGAAVFRSRQIYTPQLVVDGALECLASDPTAVRRTILEAAQALKGTMSVIVAPVSGPSAAITIHGRLPSALRRTGNADVVVAVTQDGLVTRVQRGENQGRTLTHSAVVRSLASIGHLGPQQSDVNLSTTLRLDPGWESVALRVVVFVQDAASRRIIAAGSAPFVPDHNDPH